jgi:hypothetical protein
MKLSTKKRGTYTTYTQADPDAASRMKLCGFTTKTHLKMWKRHLWLVAQQQLRLTAMEPMKQYAVSE